MKKYIITLLALSLLAGNNLIAQIAAEEANIGAWEALRSSQGDNFNPASPEAVAIKDAILAQDQISASGGLIVRRVTLATEGTQAWHALINQNEAKGPFFAAEKKGLNNEFTGWTEELVKNGLGAATRLALDSKAPQDLKELVWNFSQANPASSPQAKRFFKSYRSTLAKQDQLAATANQKELLLAVPVRNDNQNAWLAEVSADLIALSLDQQQ
jgi:hypothetical protein